MKIYLLAAAILSFGLGAVAQDTTGKKVKITSTFKPTLKEAAKINFNASPQSVDTSKPRLQYSIPNQNLSFAFQPGTLKPLALDVDTGGRWANESYLKLGFGNLSTPFVQTGLSVGDGKISGINLYGKHVSSKGKIKYQDFNHTNLDLNAFFRSGNNIEWNARFGAVQDLYKKYGFQPETLTFSDDSLRVKLQTWTGRLSFHNVDRTEFEISYAPEIKFDLFNDQHTNGESNIYINLPFQKSVNENFGVDVSLTGNLTRYKPFKGTGVSNNFVSVAPSLLYKTTSLALQAGIKPSWSNNSFKIFPNVMAEFGSNDQRVAFQLGWIGYLRNSGFQYMAGINPYIWAPANIYTSSIEERFAGFKGSAGNHFTYSAKAGYNKVTNQPLFTNDTTNGGKSFIVINESEMKVLNFGGEIGFNVGEKLSLLSNLQLNQYKTKDNEKAWGLLPLEFRTSLRIQVLKDLYVNSDLYAFDGPWYMTKGKDKNDLQGGMDLSAGAEFRIMNNLKLWLQFNNIFNKDYQRWNQYPVYGFNFLGGVVLSFAQNK